MTYRLIPVTSEMADSTNLEWRRQLRDAAGDLPEGKFLGAVQMAEKFASGETDDHAYSFALVKADNSYASALVEITHAMAGKPDAWLKDASSDSRATT